MASDPPRPTPAASPRPRLGQYELLAEIAAGGTATVFLARPVGHASRARTVAIKRLHPYLARESEFVAMFLDEARVAARIQHPNVVATFEASAGARGYFIVMEYVEGETLARLLTRAHERGTTLSRRVAVRVVLDMLAGLHAAHELRDDGDEALELVHRDVSPHNVLVGVDGVAKLADFGVARAVSRLASTHAGQLKGKLGYMSPEHATGVELDRRSDVFAAGVVLWEALAGRRLFRGANGGEADTLERILFRDIPRLRDVIDAPPALDEICARALCRDRAERFQSCDDFASDLAHAAETIGGAATHVEVAGEVGDLVGHELAERRDAVIALAPLPSDTPPPPEVDVRVELPRLSAFAAAVRDRPPPPSIPTFERAAGERRATGPLPGAAQASHRLEPPAPVSPVPPRASTASQRPPSPAPAATNAPTTSSARGAGALPLEPAARGPARARPDGPSAPARDRASRRAWALLIAALIVVAVALAWALR